ncbi:MAG TPA: S9 family peptidase, partial [Flammeovirgaceae bacterium]|nr:S9 family peptidase [Flammeovirgaceae bacterium]
MAMKRIYTLLLLANFCWFSLKAQDSPALQMLDVFELEWASDPQLSPDGSKIVYSRHGMDIMHDRRQARLWLVNSDGSQHTKLTVFDKNESGARWSPDGSRIAFISSSDVGAEIYVYWLSSGRLARLTSLPRAPHGLRWSPDGRHLAFSMLVPEKPPYLVRPPQKPKGARWAAPPRVTTRLKHERDGAGYTEPGFAQLFVVPADGGTARQITTGKFQHNAAPAWSPDGRYLYFTANRHENWEYETRNTEIYRVEVQSGEITALTDRNGPDFGVAVSPDGQTLAYLGYNDKVQTYQINHIYLMAADGTGKRQLALDFDRSPRNLQWDNKGRGLYFQYDDRGNTKIGYVSLSGAYRKVADNLGGTTIGRPYGGGSFDVGANGQIVYTYCTPYRPADLYMLNIGRLTPIT